MAHLQSKWCMACIKRRRGRAGVMCMSESNEGGEQVQARTWEGGWLGRGCDTPAGFPSLTQGAGQPTALCPLDP
eukprot:1026021-Pelagomonas_calceolata.AAC.4